MTTSLEAVSPLSPTERESASARFVFSSGAWLGLLTAVSFLLYLLTLCPTVYLGDAGELTAAGIQLGVPHPPGYPVSTLLMHVVMVILPFGSLAFRANLMSALASIVALLFLAKLVHVLIVKRLPDGWSWPLACATALTFGMSRVFWSQAIITEVYPVMMMIFIAMLWTVFEAHRRLDTGAWLTVGCLYAWGFVHHPTMWLFGPLMATWLMWMAWSKWRPSLAVLSSDLFPLAAAAFLMAWAYDHGRLVWVMGVALAGWVAWTVVRQWQMRSVVTLLIAVSLVPLAYYLYFPLRALTHPSSDWGTPETLHRVLRHVLRKQYKGLGGGLRTPEIFWLQLQLVWTYFCEQFRWPLALAGLAGLGVLWRISRFWAFWGGLIFLSLTFGGILSINFLPTLHQKELIGVFYLPAVIMLAIGLGVVAAEGVRAWQRRSPRTAWMGVALGLLLPVSPASLSWFENDLSQNFIAYYSGIDMLNAFPPHAMLFTAGDFTAFPLAYLTMGEGARPDVQMFDDYGSLFPNPYGDDFLERPGGEQGVYRRKIQRSFLVDAQGQWIEDPRQAKYCTLGADVSNWAPNLIPEGINYRMLPKDAPWSPAQFHTRSAVYALWDRMNAFDSPTQNILNQYAFARGEHYFITAQPEAGLRWYKRATADEREYEWLPNNIATMLPRRGLPWESGWFYEWVLLLNPWYTQAYMGLGNIAVTRGNRAKHVDKDPALAAVWYKEAQRNFELATKTGDPNPQAYYLMGNLFSEQERYEEAMNMYLLALGWDPNNPTYHKNLAFVLHRLKRFEEALHETEIALKIRADDFQLYYNRGAVLFEMGRLEEAKAAWLTAYQMNPKDVQTQQALAMILNRLSPGGR